LNSTVSSGVLIGMRVSTSLFGATTGMRETILRRAASDVSACAREFAALPRINGSFCLAASSRPNGGSSNFSFGNASGENVSAPACEHHSTPSRATRVFMISKRFRRRFLSRSGGVQRSDDTSSSAIAKYRKRAEMRSLILVRRIDFRKFVFTAASAGQDHFPFAAG